MSLPGSIGRRTRLVTAAAAFAGAGCAAGGGDPDSVCTTDCATEAPSAAAGSVSVSVAPTVLDLIPGGAVSAVVTVTRGGTFTGDVAFTAHPLAPGMSVTFDPNPVPPSSTSTTILVVSLPAHPDPPSSMRDSSTGGISDPQQDIALIRRRHTLVIEGVGSGHSARALLHVLCSSTCEAP